MSAWWGPWDRYLGKEHDWGGYGGGTMSLLAGEGRHRIKEEGRWEAGSRTRILEDRGGPSHHSKEDTIFWAKLGVEVR